MKITAFVPMKLNNERLPGKNTKPFTNGKPLCHYILNTLLKVKGIDEIYVYCSDPTILLYLPKGVKFLMRDPKLDGSQVKINEVLQAFAKDVPSDIYILTHATAPFIKPETIKEGIDAVKSEEYDSALTVIKQQDFFWMDGKPWNYDTKEIPRTQDLKPLYRETTGLYIYEEHLIKEENRRIGEKPKLLEADWMEAVDINNPEDFVIADAIFNHCIRTGGRKYE
ncbi:MULTISPECIES: acylneuraminate cytidylyltransferase family protein [Anaerostipes]|uniref:acylneuraminate cytidylyltransferase family protein n=1 Tax=Anaerostipes TaxID=207244 RepID=UPI00258E7401|nr:acylneuraminate cytidylyltransferase family protein [Anaerostipes sp.]MCI5624257.1 acylneuraminate cytidylyltransferase family protein [Anaerostipes sp.]MDY2726130.1 acylneuraminate cytidylyltransferase family protein [Anaerostipes faecalis]